AHSYKALTRPYRNSSQPWRKPAERSRAVSAPERSSIALMPTLYDAARCPYCARVRIVLAEKSVAYETVAVDLDDRPRWIYDLNPGGRVPVLDDDGRVLPESRVIMEYLEDRFPKPPLLPGDPMGRARVRLLIE